MTDGTRDPSTHLHAQFLRPVPEPPHEPAQRHDAVPGVVHGGRRRQRDRPAARREKEGGLLRHLNARRRPLFPPAGQQLVQGPRLQHVAAQDVRPHLPALLQHRHRQRGVELLQADRARQARRARAHHAHVALQRLPRPQLKLSRLPGRRQAPGPEGRVAPRRRRRRRRPDGPHVLTRGGSVGAAPRSARSLAENERAPTPEPVFFAAYDAAACVRKDGQRLPAEAGIRSSCRLRGCRRQSLRLSVVHLHHLYPSPILRLGHHFPFSRRSG